MIQPQTFHIPVMGVGYTIDTPLKVSRFGIDSVLSLGDDALMERLRKMYCAKFDIPYQEITEKNEDFRAERITSYLNLIKTLAEQKFEDLKNASIEKGNEIREYINMLPDSSSLKEEFKKLTADYFDLSKVRNWISKNLSMGSIDVNIMTKLDKANYDKNDQLLPVEFNNMHAAIRGYANSNLSSSVILSAGMNPRLYSYMEQFDDFYPDQNNTIRKKIVLKVSDYRSALIQGKFLAKKGLWVSEYRIESGLNCGGHAFPTEGFLLGPILEEFKSNRKELIASVNELFKKALIDKQRFVPIDELPLKISAQGGVGTAEEHNFLLQHYELDAVGWGTPFLLVPEAVSIDNATISQLSEAKEDDLYLSNISPIGIPFNNLRGNTKDIEKMELIAKGRPGSSCPKNYLALNTEFTEKPICVGSRQYVYLKLKDLDKQHLSSEEYEKQYQKVVEPSCICVGLGTSALLTNDLSTKVEGPGVSVCPGPNMAYFSKVISLKEMVDHIYGRTDVISRTDRPNLFIKELNIYIDYIKTKVGEAKEAMSAKQEKYLSSFIKNLNEGIDYYDSLFQTMKENFEDKRLGILSELTAGRNTLNNLKLEVGN